MTMQNLGLMKALNAKMNYLNHRQSVIAENIANSDTPGYRPKDLSKIDFGDTLRKIDNKGNGKLSVSMGATKSNHISSTGSVDNPKAKEQKEGLYEVSPAGNAVVMEQQLIKSNETVADYNLVSGLYQKQLNMMKAVLVK